MKTRPDADPSRWTPASLVSQARPGHNAGPGFVLGPCRFDTAAVQSESDWQCQPGTPSHGAAAGLDVV
jgi:hypothetical protein